MLCLNQMYCSAFNRPKVRQEREKKRKLKKEEGIEEWEEERERIASALQSDESPARPVSLLVCQCGDRPVRAGHVGLQQKYMAL